MAETDADDVASVPGLDTTTDGDVDMAPFELRDRLSLETPASPLAPTTLETGTSTPIAAVFDPSTPAMQNGVAPTTSGMFDPISDPPVHGDDAAGSDDAALTLAGIEDAASTTAATPAPHLSTATAAFASASTPPSKAQSPAPAPSASATVPSPARGSTPVPGAAMSSLPPSAIIPPRNGAVGSPTRVYINARVTPVLLEGMRWVAKNEPEKPLKWLAEFLMKRSAEVEGV